MSRTSLFTVGLIVSSLASCGDPASGTSSSAAPPAPPSAAAEAAPFQAKLEPAAKYEAGKPGSFNVVVDAKEGWHINPDYPYKFTIKDDVPGVDFPSMVVTDVKRTESQATMTIPFTPKDAGSKKIEGTCALSVCKAERCALEKVTLSTTVSVE